MPETGSSLATVGRWLAVCTGLSHGRFQPRGEGRCFPLLLMQRRLENFGPFPGPIDFCEIMTQLMQTGWDETTLQRAVRQGARYDPQRNTVLFPPVSER